MREDLLGVITSTKDVTNAIVLTHNIDFLFIQSVLVPALRKSGSPKLTIFADAYCSEDTYHHQHRFLSALGLRYRVVPVAMKPGFRFHPKAVLLSGTAKATLLVGSGNLTFGGWRENAEVWFRYDTDLDGTAPFAGFRNYLEQIVALCADPKQSILYETEEAFDAASRQWASSMASPSRILGHAGQGQSLLDQMKLVLKDRVASELTLCTPYFDDDAEALRVMAQEIGVNSCTVLAQSGRTNLLASAAASLGPMFSLKAASFQHREQIGSNGEERVREAFLHAKIYAILSGSEVVVFAGSANCSRAALTIPGSAGNAELMTWAVVSKEEFGSGFTSELILSDSAPVLPTENAPKTLIDADDFIHIDAARFELLSIE